MIGLDTTALIDISKNDKEILDLINDLDEDICTTIINHQEAMFGLDLKKEDPERIGVCLANAICGTKSVVRMIPNSKVLQDLLESVDNIFKSRSWFLK